MSIAAPRPLPPAALLRFRKQVEQAIRAFDLLPGLQAICKGHYKRLADYQIRIIYEVFKKCAEASVIIGGREIAKTMSIALGFCLRALTQPNFEAYFVPGGKIDMAKQAIDYINTLVILSSVAKGMSGAVQANRLEWSTVAKRFTNGSLLMAIAPNPNAVSKHGVVWCDEYQEMPEEVDEALQGFTLRAGDRFVLSGTANKRGSPLHRAHKVALIKYPQNVVEVPVEPAIQAGILSRANVEAKKLENGGKLDPISFDAWFNCRWPDVGDLAFHPGESTITERDLLTIPPAQIVTLGTGCDPGAPLSRFATAVCFTSGEIHFIKEFEKGDMQMPDLNVMSLGILAVELGDMFSGGYNYPYHSMLDQNFVRHIDSNADGDDRLRLFNDAFSMQNKGEWLVNSKKCPNCRRACEEQTFDDDGRMDRLPFTHWILVMLHGIRACHSVNPRPVAYSYRPEPFV